MRFLQVTFRCFGPFEEKSLDFSNGSLHVVYGPNEAGKSSALRGLHAFLFGIPRQTNDDYRFRKEQFRIQASLQNSQGSQLECIRRKGKVAALRAADDKTEVDESALFQFMGGLTELQFEQLFGLDHDRLVAGGNLIADGKGDLGEMLFAAGAGLAGLRKLADSLAERQGDLYKSKSPLSRSTLPINIALREHKEKLDAARECILAPEKYAAAAADARLKEAQANDLRNERAQVRRELNELQRRELALPTIALLQRARERLEAVQDAPRLPANFGEQVHRARTQRDLASAKVQDLTKACEELRQLQETASPPAALLAEETEIDELKKLVGADWSAREEEVKTEVRRSQLQGEARDIFRALTGTTNWMLMDLLRPRDEEVDRIHNLAADAKAVAQEVEAATKQVATTNEALVTAEDRAEEFRKLVDPAPLQALLESIAPLGLLAEKSQAAQLKQADEEQRLQSEFARLQPAAPGDWQAAPAVAVPAAEAVHDLRERLETSERSLAKLNADRAELDRQRTTCEQQLAAASQAAGPLPSPADLAATREQRDYGLQLIRLRLSNETDATAEQSFTGKHGAGRSVIDATEQLVRQADQLADRLRTDADQIARWQALQQNLTALQRAEQTWLTQQQAATAAHNAIQQEWRQLWQPAGITPQAPTVMQSWLTRWQRLCDQALIWQENQRQLQATQQQVAAASTQLAEACPATKGTKSFAEGLSRAKQVVQQAMNQQMEATKLRDHIHRLGMQLAAAEDQLQRAEQRQKAWKREWTTAIQVLGLNDADAEVATAINYLKRIGEMQEHLKEWRIKGKRLEELKATRTNLLHRVTSLRLRLDPAARPLTLETLDDEFKQLEIALQAARDSRTQQAVRAKSLQKFNTDLAAASAQLRTAEVELRALAALAGVAEPTELTNAMNRAQDRAAAAAEILEREQLLAESARGQPLEEFIQAATAVRDTLEADIAARTARAATLDPEIQLAEAAAFTANQLLSEYERASSAAAEAKQAAEFLTARLNDQVIEFAALQLASNVLERAKERYRARHQDTLLSRTGDFFRTLTDDKFQTLEIDNEEGNDVLKAVRAAHHHNQRVPVSGLSEGTRDQLFLALRLAGIEQHLQNREPMPLIIDDVLMTFDDDRCRATLRCLAELSKKTQVLVFTHHRHIGELASQVEPSASVHLL